MPSHLYSIRGLRVASDLPLGDLPLSDGEPDVMVRLGPASVLAVRPSRPGRFEVRAGHVFIGAVGGGVIVARHGREILVDSRPGLDRAALASLVVEEGIEAILHQRADGPAREGVSAAHLRTPKRAFGVEELLP